jgi:hypothetical protein
MEEKTAFVKAWKKHWQEAANSPKRNPFRDPITMGDTPAYPLARTLPMPPDHGYETGALSFRMVDLQLHGMRDIDVERWSREINEDRVRVKLELKSLILQGRYSLEVKPDPIVDLDTAGNLMDLPLEARQPAPAGAEPGEPTLDSQQEEWLDQARDQRTRLNQTPNGQKLMGLYNEHNETYNDVFRNYPALTTVWRAGGATKEMAADTSDAVKNDTVINSPEKRYTGNVTYNGNAFAQQLNVAAACVYADPHFNPMTGPPPGSKYFAAAKAALAFGKAVNSSTNNRKDSVHEMTPSQVHSTAQQHSGTLPDVSDQEAMMAILSSSIGPGGADENGDAGWIRVDEEDRTRIRFLHDAIMKQKAEDAAIVGQPLFEGECRARIDGVKATIELAMEDGSRGGQVRALSASVELPAFGLDIDDSQWTGEVGRIARQRLERMYFIRSLLHDSIVDHLQRALLRTVEGAYSTTLNVG